jgi:hypothetical protein
MQIGEEDELILRAAGIIVITEAAPRPRAAAMAKGR